MRPALAGPEASLKTALFATAQSFEDLKRLIHSKLVASLICRGQDSPRHAPPRKFAWSSNACATPRTRS